MTDIVSPPTISALPAAPQPADTPGEFDSKAFALLAAQVAMVGDFNSAAAATQQNATAANERADAAALKAGEALTSANNAAISKTGADSARDAAVIAKNAAEAALDSFDDRYLGAKASAPSTDNDGGVLLTGALYWDTVLDALRVWSGTEWVTLPAADASLVGFQQEGTGAVATTVQAKLRESVSVLDFGASGDGVTDDTAEFQAAIDAVSLAGGGTVTFTKRHLIDSKLTVKEGVSLKGPHGMPGEILPGTTADYDGKQGVLVVNSAATIAVQDIASVTNCIVIRKGLDLPFADAAAATAGVAAFAGTAFTVEGADATFEKLLILGFNLAIYSTGRERIRANYVSGDCTNGIDIRACFDITYVSKCHFWPWTTVHQTWTTNALLRRTGTAFLFANGGDWNKVTDCFSYGYARGFRAASVNSMTFLSCSADNTSTAGVGDHAEAIGFSVEGTSNDTRLIGCQVAAQENGYSISTTGSHTRMEGCDSWACRGNGVVITAGDIEIHGGVQRSTVNGIIINNPASRVFIDGVRFSDCSNKPIAFGAPNSAVFLGPNNDYSDVAAGAAVISTPTNWPIQAFASADPVKLPANCQDLAVTGTTNFGSLAGGWRGREVTLYFTGILTVTSSAGGSTTSMRLNSNANFVTAAGSSLKLRHSGTQWHEVGRGA